MTLEMVKPALIEYLLTQMQQSRKKADWYLQNARERMKKIAGTLKLFIRLAIAQVEEIYHQISPEPKQERQFVEAQLCRIDTHTFDRL